MQNKKLTKLLIDLGLSEGESRVYLTSLDLGPDTVLTISRVSGIRRTTVYSLIESLKQKGLMYSEMKGRKKLYVAESPEKLKIILDNKQKKFRDSLPELMAKYDLRGSENYIKFYEGFEAVKTVYEGILKELRPKDSYMAITDKGLWQKHDPGFFEKYITKRSRLNVNTRILLEDSEAARQHQKVQKNFNETIKIIPKKLKLSTNLIITPKKIVIHQLVEPIMAIVIENKNIVNMNKEMFEIMWEMIGD